jgi:hypothetical protein
MPIPYRARLDERAFLNCPGFHGGAYVLAYVEDTSGRECEKPQFGDRRVPPYPRVILELADCTNRINFEFDVRSAAERANSLHKVETLLTALRCFREAFEAECALYAEREEMLAERKRAKKERRRTRLVRS